MNIHFATNDRHRALGFLQKLYPSAIITDTEETKALLDLVEADIVHIQDPIMHSPAGIIPSDNYDDSRRSEIVAVIEKFHSKTMESIAKAR